MNSRTGFLVVVTLLAVGLCNDKHASLATDTNDGLIVERKTYDFPTYEQAVETTDVEKYTSKQVYEKLLAIQILNS